MLSSHRGSKDIGLNMGDEKPQTWMAVFNDVLEQTAIKEGFSVDAFKDANGRLIESMKRLDEINFNDVVGLLGVTPEKARALFRRDILNAMPRVQ